MSLTARVLEDAGISTVIVGSARDIVEECGVPRFVFTDVPLGNPFGPPDDAETQLATLKLALETVAGASRPRTTVQAAVVWPVDNWRNNYMLVDDSTRELLASAGDERRARQAVARAKIKG